MKHTHCVRSEMKKEGPETLLFHFARSLVRRAGFFHYMDGTGFVFRFVRSLIHCDMLSLFESCPQTPFALRTQKRHLKKGARFVWCVGQEFLGLQPQYPFPICSQ